MRQSVFSLCVALAVVVLSIGCGTTDDPTSNCGPANCGGCCDEKGFCQLGNTDSLCGTGGGTCAHCPAGALCTASACVATQVDAGVPPCSATAVDCSDSAILNLDLKSGVAPGLIKNSAEGAGWLSTVDATAGGMQPTQGYVYAKFGATGLEKVAIDDLQAIESLDWDIAFRRYVIRINGGDSGPSCTSAFELPVDASYAALTAEPSGFVYGQDDFLTASPTCTFVADGKGLPSPKTALSSFYDYTIDKACVATTGQVFVLRTRAGRTLKVLVTTYYQTEVGQTACNTTGSSGGAIGGTVRMRWQFLN